MTVEGVYAAAVTPRVPGGAGVDVAATLELIDFLCAAGAQGLALFGSTGEFPGVKFEDRIRMVNLAAKRSRAPLLVGVGDACLNASLELGREAVAAGATGLLLTPPYYFRYEQEDIREFYLRFAEQMGKDVRIYLYNVPFFTNEIACDTALELLSTGLFAGIKESSGQFEYFLRLKELCDRQPFTILVGNDNVFTQCRRSGAHGVVSGVACPVPELILGLDCAIRKGDEAKIDRLEARLQEFIGWLNRFPIPLGVRVATEERGLKVGPPATPLCAAKERTLEEFREWFRAWLPAVQKEAEVA